MQSDEHNECLLSVVVCVCLCTLYLCTPRVRKAPRSWIFMDYKCTMYVYNHNHSGGAHVARTASARAVSSNWRLFALASLLDDESKRLLTAELTTFGVCGVYGWKDFTACATVYLNNVFKVAPVLTSTSAVKVSVIFYIRLYRSLSL